MRSLVCCVLVGAVMFETNARSLAQNPEPAPPTPAETPIATPPPINEDKSASTIPAEDGLLREGLNEASRHPLAAPALAASPEAVKERHVRRSAARRRRHQLAKAAAATPARVTVHSSAHRSPLVSIVYWWNGWVMKTFHTKTGTVMLKKVGAKT